MKVVDNFLSDYHFKHIQSSMLGTEFPWYYNKETVRVGDGFSTCTHNFTLSSQYFLMDPFISGLKMEKVYRIKSNLTKKTIFHRKCFYHTDDCVGASKTAVYYLNTNNGWTHIKGYDKVKSVANRIVIFDSNLKHAGVTCTDEDIRVVINFNWK